MVLVMEWTWTREMGEPESSSMTEAGHRSQVTGKDRTFSDAVGRAKQSLQKGDSCLSGREWSLEPLLH